MKLALLGMLSSVSAQGIKHLNFSFDPSDPFGPQNWNKVDITGNEWEEFDFPVDVDGNECGSTRRPSPLNLIDADGDCDDNHEMLTRLIRNTDCKKDDTWWSITPHTLRFDFPKNRNKCRPPSIDISGGKPGNWYLLHVEIHIRSEHVIEGRRYDGEILFIHGDNDEIPNYVTIVSQPLDASMPVRDDMLLQDWINEWQAIYDNNEAICSASTRSSNSNININMAMETVVKDDGSEMRLNYRKVPQTRIMDDAYFEQLAKDEAAALAKDPAYYGYDPNDPNASDDEDIITTTTNEARRLQTRVVCPKMFPYDIWPTVWYYGYEGQLPHPPCSEVVFYRVMDEPLRISRKQFKQIAKLMTSYRDDNCKLASKASPKGETYRPLAEINNSAQELFHCTREHFGRKKHDSCTP